MIFLLRQLWLEWPNCCSLFFFSYFIKIFSFSPLYLLWLLALYCGLHVFLSYRSNFLPFVLIKPLGQFSYCLLLGHRFESSPLCLLWHLLTLWNSGLSNVDADRYGVIIHCRTLRLAWNLYSWFSLVFYDNAFCVLQLAATCAQKLCNIGIFCYCVMLLLIKVRFCVSHLLPSLDLSDPVSVPLHYIHQNARI